MNLTSSFKGRFKYMIHIVPYSVSIMINSFLCMFSFVFPSAFVKLLTYKQNTLMMV